MLSSSSERMTCLHFPDGRRKTTRVVEVAEVVKWCFGGKR